jgi:hypothetical protein
MPPPVTSTASQASVPGTNRLEHESPLGSKRTTVKSQRNGNCNQFSEFMSGRKGSFFDVVNSQ